MIAIRIPYTSQDLSLKFLDKFALLLRSNVLNSLLEHQHHM